MAKVGMAHNSAVNQFHHGYRLKVQDKDIRQVNK